VIDMKAACAESVQVASHFERRTKSIRDALPQVILSV